MAGCPFCRKEEDTHDRKIYNTCDIASGQRCPPCAEYLGLEAEIEKTLQTLEEQLVRKRAIRRKINQLHDPLLSRVPREITAYIFKLASCVENKKNDWILGEGEMWAPLPLGRVSGAWRDIAWGMPQLWNFMFAKLNARQREVAPHFDIAKQWLKRSGDYLPLSIHLYIDEDCDEPDLDNCEVFIPFIELLNVYASRWRDLTVYGPVFLFEHLSAISQGAPNLRNLQLLSALDDYSDDYPLIFDLGCTTIPQPRRLHINNVIAQRIVVDWSQITQLETDSPIVIGILQLLPELRELRDLKIRRVTDDIDTPYEPFPHPKLQSFAFTCCGELDGDRVPNLLDAFVFPSLQHFAVDLRHSLDYVETVTAFLRRSSCRLISLSISHIPHFGKSENHRFIPFLQCLDLLEELEILDCEWAKGISEGCHYLELDLFELMVLHWQPYDSDQAYMPKLRRLKYRTPDFGSGLWAIFFLHLGVSATDPSSSGDLQVYIQKERRAQGLPIPGAETGGELLFLPRKTSKLKERLLSLMETHSADEHSDTDSESDAGE